MFLSILVALFLGFTVSFVITPTQQVFSQLSWELF